MKQQPTVDCDVECERSHGMQPSLPGAHHFKTQNWDVVQVHRLWVKGWSDDQITVVSIQRGEASNGTNLLHRPVKLLYLNNVLQWFNWMAPPRTEGLLISIDHRGPLMMSVTKEAPVDWVAKHSDEAYARWLEANPGGTVDQYLAYLADRVHQGLNVCNMSQCFDRAVPGSPWCADHTEHMNKIQKALVQS